MRGFQSGRLGAFLFDIIIEVPMGSIDPRNVTCDNAVTTHISKLCQKVGSVRHSEALQEISPVFKLCTLGSVQSDLHAS